MALGATAVRWSDDVTYPEESKDEDVVTAEVPQWTRFQGDIEGLVVLSSAFEASLQQKDASAATWESLDPEYGASVSRFGSLEAEYFSCRPCLSEWTEVIRSHMSNPPESVRSYLARLYFLAGSDQRLQLEQELVRRYGQFEQVDKIHLHESPQGIGVFVWLDQPKYDSELMHQLLDQEWTVGEQFADQPLEFFYFPLPADDTELPVPDTAKLIFRHSSRG